MLLQVDWETVKGKLCGRQKEDMKSRDSKYLCVFLYECHDIREQGTSLSFVHALRTAAEPSKRAERYFKRVVSVPCR